MIARLALVLTTMLLGGCLGGSVTPRTYYALQYPVADAAAAYEGPRFPLQLRVRRLDIKIAYDKQEIVYRTSPYEFSYYWYRLWAAKPQKMLTELVADHVMRTGLFAEVTTRILDRLPDYELQGEVLAIEELDADDVWFAHLSIRLALVRFADGQAVWSREFDDRQRVYEKKPEFVVRALSELLEKYMRVATVEISGVVARDLAAGAVKPGAELGPDAIPRPPERGAAPKLEPIVPMPDRPIEVAPEEPKTGEKEDPKVPKARLKR
jgi:ABC-type uncharacterized transport system auxiliary subunit